MSRETSLFLAYVEGRGFDPHKRGVRRLTRYSQARSWATEGEESAMAESVAAYMLLEVLLIPYILF